MIPILVNSDCLKALKAMPEASVDMVVTSPPYNKHSAKRKCRKGDTWLQANIGYGDFQDDLPEDVYQEQQKEVIRALLRVLKPTGSIFYNHKYRIINHRAISPELWLSEFIIRQVIIWDRGSSPVLEPIRFMPTIEQIYWITKEQKTPYFTREGFQFKDVWRINPERGNDHPAPFPVEIPRRCIIAACPPGGVVLDPYMGSCSTGVACKELDRQFIGIELNPKFYAMAKERLK